MPSLDDLPHQQTFAVTRFALATWLSTLREARTQSEVLSLVNEFIAQLEGDDLATPPHFAERRDSPEMRFIVVFFRAVSQRLSQLLPPGP